MGRAAVQLRRDSVPRHRKRPGNVAAAGRAWRLSHRRTAITNAEGFVLSKLQFEIVAYRPEYALEVVKMWRRSFQRAMGLQEQNRFDEVSRQLDILSTIDPGSIHIALDPDSSAVLGFMVVSDGKLDHLYVHVDCQGMGLGSALLDLAKLQSPAGIELFTFQRNRSARSFYERRGFREVGRGFASLDGNPWATEREELADIKFRWEGCPDPTVAVSPGP